MHLRGRDVRVPVRGRAPTRVRAEVHAGEPEGRRDHRGGALPVGAKALSVLVQLRVVFAGTPRSQYFADRRNVGAHRLSDGLEIGRKQHDLPHIEVAIRPTVEPLPDPLRDRIIDRRMAERTTDADGHELVGGEKSLHSDDRIGAEQLERHLGVVQVQAPALDGFEHDARELPGIDLEPHVERLSRSQAGTHPAASLARNRLVQAELRAPKLLASERFVAKGFATLLEHPVGVFFGIPFVGVRLGLARSRRVDVVDFQERFLRASKRESSGE